MVDRPGGDIRQEAAFAADNNVVPIRRARAARPAQRNGQQPLAQFHLLGAMRAAARDGQNLLPRGRKARALLGYLCLHPGEAVARSRLAALLWDRVSDAQAATSFRQALRELSQAMEPLGQQLIGGERNTVSLDSSCCWIDAHEVLSNALASGVHAPGELLEGLDGISGSFDQWLLTERTHFSGRLREKFEAELRVTAGLEAGERAAGARRIIAFDPTHEGASRSLMRALMEMGERAQAMQEYERCREAVRSSLDVEPSAETRALYQALRTVSSADAPPVIAPPPGELAQVVSLRTPSRLRVMVRPFQALGSHVEAMAAMLLSQEIAGGLARFRWFEVIGAGTYREGSLLPQSRPDYIVEGHLSGGAQRVQVSVRLLDMAKSQLVWSDRFDVPTDELDDLNERIVGPVVARIDPVILFIEGQQRKGKPLDADGLVLKAIPLMYSMEREKYEAAGRLIEEALKADDSNANVLAWAAFWQVWHVGQGWSADPVQALVIAQDRAVRAIRLDPENAEATGIYGHICAFLNKDFEAAMHYFDRALQLNPNLAFVWAMSAPTCCYVGQPDSRIEPP